MSWRKHRLFAFVLLGFALLAFHESRTPGLGSLDQGEPPEWLLDPDRNLADVYAELFPERASSYHYRALQASLCARPGFGKSPECVDFDLRNHHDERDLLGRAVATGNRSNERILYNYALNLIHTGGSASEIDAVLHRWRRDYPHSALPELRRAGR